MLRGRGTYGGRWRRFLRRLALVLAISTAAAPARAQEPVRVGIGFGLAFLPMFLCEELKLIEKHGKDVHLNLKASYQRFLGTGPLQDALAAGAVDLAPFGIAPLLAAWEKGKGTPRQILAVAGMSTMPLTLLTNRAGVRTIADFRPSDRIAVPTASSPQTYLLQMQSEKVFGQYDRLQSQIVPLSHPDAVAALIAAGSPTTGYFASAPYTEIALEDGRIRKVLTSADIVGGKASFLVLGASRRYVTAQAKAAEAVAKAIDEAASIIHDDPRRAAQIYLTHEPSRTLNAAAVEGILRELKDEFGSPVHGIEAFAAFMGRHGELKTPPQNWKDVVAPPLANSPSS
jgi:ABC-type nitrate/sulfonate/bicarbonate transport system substrate-binding protein